MPALLEHESTHFLVARIRGELSQMELKEFQGAAGPLFKASGDMRLLVILEDFNGWESGRGWEDASFAEEYDPYLTRFAIVGDEAWRDQVLMFALAGLRPVEIEYFATENEAEARSWLAEGL